jgi:SNF2 family DNA or RNA helicase
MSQRQKLAPLEHQLRGTQFLRSKSAAALFDEQGLGKSKQMIDALAQEIHAGSIRAALIVCPNGLKSNWAQEIEKFSTLKYAVFGSGQAARRTGFRSLQASLYVINYEAVPAEMASLRALLKFKPMAVVLDESHRIKTPNARVTRAVLALRGLAHRRYILSGTPVANKPTDLWSQALFLDDGQALGATFDEFKRRYLGSEGYRHLDVLRDQLGGLGLRRTKLDALALPAKRFQRIVVELTGVQAAMYERMRSELEVWVTSLDGEHVVKSGRAILARLVRLAQLASNPALLDRGYRETPAKLSKLDEFLAKVAATDPTRKAIVWTSFVGNVKAMLSRYAAWNPVAIYGQTSNEERDAAVRAFREDASVRLMIANPSAAREGLTLTEANLAIYLDRTFNLVDYLQSQDRIHRLSQTRDCDVVILIACNTIDEFIDFALEQKHRIARFTQGDAAKISDADLALTKPEILRTLLAPTTHHA